MRYLLLAILCSLSLAQAQDNSNCFTNEPAARELEARGFTKIGCVNYEVMTYSYGQNHYWKTVEAIKYQNAAGYMAFATCYGILGGNIKLGVAQAEIPPSNWS